MQERKRLKQNAKAKKLLIKTDIAKSERPALPKEKQKRLNDELFNAAWHGNANNVERLIKVGANIEAKDHFDDTALMLAAKNGHTETCKLLLERGANIEAKDKYGWTVLMQAAWNGRTETTGFLKFYLIRKILGNEANMFISSFSECIA
jgi:ankyrin repeat protein